MLVEIKVPAVGESINEVTLSKWIKSDGDIVQQDEVLCELESEKATFELTAEKGGQLKIVVAEASSLKIGDLVCTIDTEVAAEAETAPQIKKESAVPPPQEKEKAAVQPPVLKETYVKNFPSPAAGKIIRESGAMVTNGTGKDGRITKLDAVAAKQHTETVKPQERGEKRQPMSSLRKTVSKRLVAAKNSTAMLTTFNEVDMKSIIEIRTKYKELFKEKHGIGLGFMSFFAKAVCFALKEWPAVNAYIEGDNIIYHDYCDISIAVSTPKGLVVPVIRSAESLSFAELEQNIADLAKRGRDNKLSPEEMTGGTFTITNGGVFGSLMSTPIINLPQSAILGMHKIEERVVVISEEMTIRPMMYVALSYDHRIIDGRESVSFLVRVKELLENPQHLLMGTDPIKSMLQM
ncbi:MAG: 2-oxoglutarate dehydrogenase complex dihydrolipoyllysine-residue succinyltransferase [Chitinophagales bacterium]|nr:2-oxoglutarate dehydrogenase complex dihydrolipoyllysine-residue succinyltransferase [Chitinophagales bacterium]